MQMLARLVVPLVLLGLLAGVYLQLWTGRGSLQHVQEMQLRLTQQLEANAKARAENERLASEVQDLKAGLDMVEEKARYELGMVKQGEIYVHVHGSSSSAP